MTPIQFEFAVVNEFAKCGYWVHRIAPNAAGQQPFDIIALKENDVWAVDAKLLRDTAKSFTMDRVEDNQRLAMRKISKIVPQSHTGFIIGQNGNFYWLPYNSISDKKSVKISDLERLQV